MLGAHAHPTAAEATSDSDRPAFHYVYKHADVPAAATAVRALPAPPASSAAYSAAAAAGDRPPVISAQALYPMCFAYALLTPPSRDPGADILGAILAAAPDLWATFTVLPSAHGTAGLRFTSPADRESAMRLQPFAHAGAVVTLVRGWETAVLDDYLVHGMPDCLVRSPDDLLVHAALRRYPAEQRTEREIGANCRGFGWVLEVDRACFAAPDLAAVHVVLCVGHPREIPRELRIVFADGSTSGVPVDVLAVFDWATAFRAHGRYVRFFRQSQGAAAPADLLGSRLQRISLS
uniref:Uncharacterized protein n=1 Tax=Avena sativa TaxID=4498 RepID=A0ACD6A6K1_AVESA